jgi:hypothetical protein
LGETPKRTSLKKAVPEGLKSVECERGVGGKNSPIHYIPEHDPIQDVLETKNQPTPLKFTLPNGSEMIKMRAAAETAHLDLDIAKTMLKKNKGDNEDTPSREVMQSRS